MEGFQQANYYEYIVEKGRNSNYGFMIKSLDRYALQLSYARSLLFKGQNIKKYYKLGPNINSNKEFLLYLQKFT